MTTTKINRLVSIILPIKNASAILVHYMQELYSIMHTHFSDFEIVLIDDGSHDDSAKVSQQLLNQFPHIRFIQLSRGHGEVVAISVGLDTVIGDYAIVLDLQTDSPQLIPAIIQQALAGKDIIYGVNINPAKPGLLRKVFSKMFHWYLAKFVNISIPRHMTTLRCLSRDAINAITKIEDMNRYYRYFGEIIGFNSDVFYYQPKFVSSAHTKKPLMHLINEGVQIIIENTPHPLRFFTWLGLFITGVNLIYILYVIVVFLFKQDVITGWTTLSLQISVLFMGLMLIMTVLSEYIGRIVQKLQNKPLYFVKAEKQSSVVAQDHRLNITAHSEKCISDG